MFSNSNSYLSGANSGRPGPPQYGQQSYGQVQPNQFSSQPTGYNGGVQFQATGYGAGQPQPSGYGGGLQPQPTAYGAGLQPQSNGFGGGLQPHPTGFGGLQSQPTGFEGSLQSQYPGYSQQLQQQPPQPIGFHGQTIQAFQQQVQPPLSMQQTASPAPRQQPQPTGMTSSQMADSFRSSGATTAPRKTSGATGSKIPNMRLSFIVAQDQAKFEQLFKSAVGKNQALSGDQARDLLLRSKLDGDTLGHIWALSDTTKSGQLMFPEFALAMYLCNLKLTGKPLPPSLPDRVKNEVSSMVDIISFGVPDDNPQGPQRSNAPNFTETPMQSSFSSSTMQQPQPQQASTSPLLSQLTPQSTSYQTQPSSQFFKPQPTGMATQQTGFMNTQQPSGYSGPIPPTLAMPGGFQSNQGGPSPLNAQPTGRPGQWGLVNAPASGLPNLEALQQQMMPQPGRESGFTSTGLRGNATVPWAVTKDEKKIYDNMFKSWDGFGKGSITGNQAIEIFGQSGLEKKDLEAIWTLSDSNNKGRLDLDEFAVAMHLIYRKLNGYPVPTRLPPELVPPSTRNLSSSLGTMKAMLSRDAEERKSSATFLEPQKTGVSYLKSRSFKESPGPTTSSRKDATVFKNDDSEFGYKSSARRRIGADGRSLSPVQSSSPVSEAGDDLSLEQLEKQIREKQVLLDALDFGDENEADQDDILDRKDRRDADELFRRIRNIQEEIDTNPNASLRSGGSGAERRTLKRQLQGLTDRLPEIASKVRSAERAIVDARLELFRLKDSKTHPSSAAAVIGTGPGGQITESDRLKARAKAMMQQRSAALTGKASTLDSDDATAATKRLEEESAQARSEKDNNDRMVNDVEESVRAYSKGVEDSLKDGAEDNATEHEKRRWQDGLGVEDEVKDFIFDLQRSSRSAQIRREDTSHPSRRKVSNPPQGEEPSRQSTASRVESPAPRNDSASRAPTNSASGSYSNYKTAEDRVAFIKQQAEQRMAERLAALGLRGPSKAPETAPQRQERERKDKEERLRQAEAEDSKREQERQRRLADEQIVPPSINKSTGKKPPPPPSRKGRSDSAAKQLDHDNTEKALKEQQATERMARKDMEDEEQQQEVELRKAQEASESRRKALEEQVKQGKIKKVEEKRRKQVAAREIKEKEDRLTAQRAQLEAAREEERKVQEQLDALAADDDSSSSDDAPQHTPEDNTPTASQELPEETPGAFPSPTPSVLPVPALAAPSPQNPLSRTSSVTSPPPASADPETKNPFFKRMQADTTTLSTPQQTPPGPPTDTNPFHRLPQQDSSNNQSSTLPPLQTQSRSSRVRPEEDDWSVVDSDASDDNSEDQPPGGGTAKQLASILFGTMAPPRPMSAVGNDRPSEASHLPPPMPGAFEPPPPTTPGAGAGGSPTAPPPPPPPPMPGAFDATPLGGPPSAPPPPPVMPSMGGNPPVNKSGLLGEIQMGKGLRKVQTKDRSTSSTAGRVL